MGKKTGISWTDHTFNPWWGCTKWSEGCKNCYAEAFADRFKHDVWGPGKPRRTFEEKHWREPELWNRAAKKTGEQRRVFCGSMMDWTDPEAPADSLTRLFPLIKRTPWLVWMLLTKRTEWIEQNLPSDWSVENYPNVWLGTTIELDRHVWRAETLAAIPAFVHFISAEPLLGPLPNLNLHDIEWLIVGGESGSGSPYNSRHWSDNNHHQPSHNNRRAPLPQVSIKTDKGYRGMEEEWAVDLRDRCSAGNVHFFYKQGNGLYPGMNPYLQGKKHKQIPSPHPVQ